VRSTDADRSRVPILMYHAVMPEPPSSFLKYAITPKTFAAQIGWLARAGYESIDLDTLLDARAGRRTLPRKPVVITFDDGFQNCADHAVPILADRGFTAIFYLVAGLMGGSSRWLVDILGLAFPLMDWTTVRDLERDGFFFGAHTMSHPHLAEVTPERCREEVVTSRRVLEDGLGHEVRHFAYPHGSYDPRVRDIVAEAGYRSACSVEIGYSPPTDDPLILRRIPVNGDESFANFVIRLQTGHTGQEMLGIYARGVRRRLDRLRTGSSS
jgi:peptidoglycan/xylan/chitin deacetylase (PgdA/CDA1 family)